MNSFGDGFDWMDFNSESIMSHASSPTSGPAVATNLLSFPNHTMTPLLDALHTAAPAIIPQPEVVYTQCNPDIFSEGIKYTHLYI
jgi:hypothetical protein